MISSDVRTDLRLAGMVKRYSTWPVINPQSTGEHTWQILRIYIEIFGPPPPEVTEYIVHHDSAELIVGDPPFPLKMNNPDLKEIYSRLENDAMRKMRASGMPKLDWPQTMQVKICDLIEMWEYGLHELKMGNGYAEPIIEDTITVILRMIDRQNCEGAVLDYIEQRRERMAR